MATKSGRRNGRPSKLTPEMQQAICTLLANHHSIETACEFVGIWTSTFYDWMNRGAETRTGLYSEFHNMVKKASAQSQVQLVKVVNDAAMGAGVPPDWKAAAWILERRHRQWGRVQVYGQQPPENPDGSPLPVTTSGIAVAVHLHLTNPGEDPFHPANGEDKAEGEHDEQWSAKWDARLN